MPSITSNDKPQSPELLQGTLDMLILKTLAAIGPNHGYAVVRRIQQTSADVLRVEEGSLYPALHRMERRGLLESHWQQSEANRRAKYYRLTSRGRSYLKAEIATWETLSTAIDRVLGSTSIAGA